MLYTIIWAACIAFVSSQILVAYPPSFTRVARNWRVLPTDPVGTVVARAQSERPSNYSVNYGIETANPPVPFTIDPVTGIVTVNDTLSDKENNEYSLWVTSYDGDILQRIEIVATVTHQSVSQLPIYPNIRNLPQIPGMTAITRNRNNTEENNEQEYIDDALDMPITGIPIKAPELTTEETVISEDKERFKSIILEENTIDVCMTVLPLVAVYGLGVSLAGVILFFVWRRSTSNSSKGDSIKITT